MHKNIEKKQNKKHDKKAKKYCENKNTMVK